MASVTTTSTDSGQEQHEEQKLGPFLCWAVVFADIGTSIYYVPGILYGTVGKLAGFFVLLTMTVFILLTFKYVEVTYRFPQGGGVVTVAARALNQWFGALGGMFILVDYFLTAAISSLSGMFYLSVVLPAIGPGTTFFGQSITLWITLVILVLLGVLNWVGVNESAKVSMVGAVIAFVSDIAILVTVFTHISFSMFLSLFPQMFSGKALTPVSLLVGFAGSFLAFSGLESISQLSPVMKVPRKAVGKLALFLVILTVGLTSPLLTVLSTLLLPKAAADPVLSSQIISLLGGRWGGVFLQTEVAISASALLVFASNTAIIGSYHVFLALSRMEFFPKFILQRNKLRGTPHYSIALATIIPILVLLAVHGDITILGDMYAFGLLGAFSLTCLGMDIVRYRQRRYRRLQAVKSGSNANAFARKQLSSIANHAQSSGQDAAHERSKGDGIEGETEEEKDAKPDERPEPEGRWARSLVNFWLGILTTLLVLTAWTTNLIAKPLATAFGGSVALLGMAIAFTSYRLHRRKGRTPVVVTGVEKDFPGAVLAVLATGSNSNEAIIQAAITNPDKKPVVFLYLGQHISDRKPELFRLIEPHLNDEQASKDMGRANYLAQEAKIECRFIYRRQEPGAIYRVWQELHPQDTIIAEEQMPEVEQIHAKRVENAATVDGTVIHLLV
ncbi:MAG: APC family permease [Ktedonobacteraceae bacterium]